MTDEFLDVQGRAFDLFEECRALSGSNGPESCDPPQFPHPHPEDTDDGRRVLSRFIDNARAWLIEKIPPRTRLEYKEGKRKKDLEILRRRLDAAGATGQHEHAVFACIDDSGTVLGLVWTEEAAVLAEENGDCAGYKRMTVRHHQPIAEDTGKFVYTVGLVHGRVCSASILDDNNRVGPYKYHRPHKVDDKKWLVRADSFDQAARAVALAVAGK